MMVKENPPEKKGNPEESNVIYTWRKIVLYLKDEHGIKLTDKTLRETYRISVGKSVVNNRKVVVISKDKLDDWAEKYKRGEIRHKKKKRKLIVFFLLSTLIFLGIFILIAKLNRFSKSWVKHTLLIRKDVKGNNVILKVLNFKNDVVKEFIYKYSNSIKVIYIWNFISKTPFYKVCDLNGDFLDDLLIISPENPCTVQIWIQTGKGELKLYKEKTITLNHFFESDILTEIDKISSVNVGDVVGDKAPEIVLTLCNDEQYPSAVLILEKNLNPIFTIYHPGWLTSTEIRDLNRDGKNEIYVAGTNNYIFKRETSEEIAFCVEIFNEKGTSAIDLYSKGRKMFKTVPNGINLVYARLNFLDFSFWKRKFQISKIIFHQPMGNKYYIQVGGGIIARKNIEGINFSTPLRYFLFDYMLKYVNSFWDYENLAYMLPSSYRLNEVEINRKLIPRYWNGKGWQKKWCKVPNR